MDEDEQIFYTERHADLLEGITEEYEKQDKKATSEYWGSIGLLAAVVLGLILMRFIPGLEILVGFAGLALIALVISQFSAKSISKVFSEGSRFIRTPVGGAATVAVVSSFQYGANMRKSCMAGCNKDFKEKIVKAIAGDVAPELTYDPSGRMQLEELPMLFGRDLIYNTEDRFDGVTQEGVPFIACEVHIGTKDEEIKDAIFDTKFKGYVWRFDNYKQEVRQDTFFSTKRFGRYTIDPSFALLRRDSNDKDAPWMYAKRLKEHVKYSKDVVFNTYDIDPRMWNVALDAASEVNSNLCVVYVTRKYLYVAINTRRDLFEVTNGVDEIALQAIADDIRYIASLPQRLGNHISAECLSLLS